VHSHRSRRKTFIVPIIAVLLLCLVSGSLPFGARTGTAFAADTVFYDFVAQASSASWSSGAGTLSFPGSDSDSRGFALYRDNWQLEDNSIKTRVLETHPQWVSNGWIMGIYPQVTVPSNAEIKITVGFIKGATASNGVTFEVKFQEFRGLTQAPAVHSILSHDATYDGKLDSLTANLSSVAGKTGNFVLYVNAGQSSGQDWAAWAEAKIEIAAPPALPDLIVETIELGEGNKLSVTIRNIGTGALPAGWAALGQIWVNDEDKGTFSLQSPTSSINGGIAASGGSSTYLLSWAISETAWVACRVDVANTIVEANEQNNYKKEKLQPPVVQLPDLIVERIICDQENSRIGYVIKNVGEATAAAPHITALLVNDETICNDAVAVELAPGQTYQSWFNCYSWSDCQRVEVKACADNTAVIEESNEHNNCLSQECLCAPPTECPTGCQCLLKDEGYSQGLEFCLDDYGAPIICEVIDAERGEYKYCFKPKGETLPPAKPVFPKRDIDGDDHVNDNDLAIIAAHYGGNTGSSHVPWDINDDGCVDYKDLAIVGAHFGRSVTQEKLEGVGITTARQLLDRVRSANGFQELSLRADVTPERLLRAVWEAELREALSDIDDSSIGLLEGLNIGSLSGLSSLAAEDPDLMNVLHHELELEWIASGGKERGDQLPTLDDLTRWITLAKTVTPLLTVMEGMINFPDGGSVSTEDEPESGDASGRLPEGNFGLATSQGFSSRVFREGYPGVGSGVTEGARPLVPPPSIPEPCPRLEGYILRFPYDISTLKIRAERIESVMQFDPITRDPLGFSSVAVEGKLVDIQQANVGPHGSPVTFYSTGCITPGRWKLTPIFYAEESETVVWRGDWSPRYYEVEISSGLDSPVDVDFTFVPLETTRPTISISHTPREPDGDDVVSFTVTVSDNHMLQKIQVYEWGRYFDGSQTEPQLVASYFWGNPPFPREEIYRFERGPYPLGGPKEIHFEVAAWDYAGNPQSATDVFVVQQLEVPPLATLGVTIPPSLFRYYIGSIAEVVTSKDSDDGEGELHPNFNVEMIATNGGLYREFRQDYPYFKHVEADASDGRPYCAPWIPVLAVRESELDSCSAYSLHAHVYESDSALERVIRAIGGFFDWLIDAVMNFVTCVFGDITGCEHLICDVFLPANEVCQAVMDPEDDYIGSAHFMTTAEANFGLSGNPAADFYTMVGTPDANNTDWIGTTAEGSVEYLCRIGVEAILTQGVSTATLLGDNWIEVTYHPEVFMTKPIEKMKVKFVGAKVLNDRDGFWRGSGDVYARTLVGTVGGEPSDFNDHSILGDDLNQLPYSAADIYGFDCGGVDSGDSFTKDKIIFDRSFSNPNVALLYVQIALWDSDGWPMPDNEIGVLSIPWPATSIFDMIEHPSEAAARYGEGISVTIVHPVETYEGTVVYVEGWPDRIGDEYYYVIRDTREVWTRMCRKDSDGSLWGHPGAQITYEIWVKPASR